MYTHSFNFWLREKLSYTVNIGNDCLCDIIHGLIVTNIVCILPSGGAGGLGGRGIKCHEYTTWMDPFQKYCTDKGLTGRASRGQPGPSGASGKSNIYCHSSPFFSSFQIPPEPFALIFPFDEKVVLHQICLWQICHRKDSRCPIWL